MKEAMRKQLEEKDYIVDFAADFLKHTPEEESNSDIRSGLSNLVRVQRVKK